MASFSENLSDLILGEQNSFPKTGNSPNSKSASKIWSNLGDLQDTLINDTLDNKENMSENANTMPVEAKTESHENGHNESKEEVTSVPDSDDEETTNIQVISLTKYFTFYLFELRKGESLSLKQPFVSI